MPKLRLSLHEEENLESARDSALSIKERLGETATPYQTLALDLLIHSTTFLLGKRDAN